MKSQHKDPKALHLHRSKSGNDSQNAIIMIPTKPRITKPPLNFQKLLNPKLFKEKGLGLQGLRARPTRTQTLNGLGLYSFRVNLSLTHASRN